MGRVDGKVAIITGGATGIGAATSRLLAREGAKVGLLDVLEEEGQRLEAVGRQSGEVVKFWRCDISDEERVQSTFEDVYRQWGGLDILVNNAAIVGLAKPTHEMSAAEWESVIRINVNGTFFCTKHAIRYMKMSGGGSIINISSIYGLVGAADVPAYHASKGAVRLMAKTDAVIYAKDKIRVNSIFPGFIMTPMTERFLKSQPDYGEALRAVEKLHPLGHLGEPEDIAYGVLFLASDESKFVTGADLSIDGGYTAQ